METVLGPKYHVTRRAASIKISGEYILFLLLTQIWAEWRIVRLKFSHWEGDDALREMRLPKEYTILHRNIFWVVRTIKSIRHTFPSLLLPFQAEAGQLILKYVVVLCVCGKTRTWWRHQMECSLSWWKCIPISLSLRQIFCVLGKLKLYLIFTVLSTSPFSLLKSVSDSNGKWSSTFKNKIERHIPSLNTKLVNKVGQFESHRHSNLEGLWSILIT